MKTITVGGAETKIYGNSEDPYFQGVEGAAVGLQSLVEAANRIPRDAVVLDVGANIGLSTILLARRAARVIAYEPSPVNVGFLRENLAANGITNVTVEPVAVSNKASTLRFHEAQFGAGSHVVSQEHLANGRVPTIDIPAISLDSQNLPPIAFMKIDAEGHEPEVLAGARSLLAREQPIVYMEINIWCLCAFAGHSPGTLVKTLWERFEVENAAGVPLSDPYAFLHETITRGGVADVLLRPKGGVQMPTLPELTWPASAQKAASEYDDVILAAFVARPR
jgi:FkbM family methyltransferase